MTADPEEIRLAADGRVPNSRLPVLLYRAVLAGDAGAAAFERLFASHGWTGAWRNGIYPFHHFHSTAHEVLGIASGAATLRLGGETGKDVAVAAGDVLVLPAGTGHKRVSASAALLVVGAYPDGRDWDLLRADDVTNEVLARAERAIATLPVPEHDPVTGDAMRAWTA